MEEEIVLKAKLLFVVFRNDSNGYTVAKFVTYDANEEDFTATGYFGELHEDVIYKLYGDYVDHPRYGMQFQVKQYEKMMPNDESSLVRFFSSSLFPGIGKQTAQAIVDALGEDAVQLIKDNHDILKDIPVLNERKRISIIQGIMEHDDLDDSVVFFTRMGISVKTIMKLEAIYGETAVSVVKQNPYRLVEDVEGIGFKTADKIAKSLNFEDDHPYRIKAAILAMILDICMQSGDTYITIEQLQRRFYKAFDRSIALDTYLVNLQMERNIIIEDERIYHHTQYDAQNGIAMFLSEFPTLNEKNEVFDEEDISILEDKFHITYEEKQRKAITSFFKESFMILTGGPGTGKTTIVKGVLELYKHYFPNDTIALCAPTGRAAKRLSQLSDAKASTIHSLLKWDLETNTFLVNKEEPIDADLLIIDEFSMVDQWLFYNLLQACGKIKKILIIGDEDQLPSVGCGSVLRDLIESNCFPIVRLNKIFRQSEGSDVITLAHQIREGNADILDNAKDVAFFECANYEVKDLVVSIVYNALEKGYDVKDIQVLAPMYGGVAGIDALNNALQKMMNPADEYKKEVKVGYRLFREHDKILQLKNQPDDEVFNGDIGEIIDIQHSEDNVFQKNCILADFDGVEVEYSGEQIYNITHAYATSIHKAQGSEYAIVIMPVVSDYRYMLQKRLLYTGVTRARNSLVLLGEKEVFLKSLKVEDRHVRKSTLKEKIIELMG